MFNDCSLTVCVFGVLHLLVECSHDLLTGDGHATCKLAMPSIDVQSKIASLSSCQVIVCFQIWILPGFRWYSREFQVSSELITHTVDQHDVRDFSFIHPCCWCSTAADHLVPI